MVFGFLVVHGFASLRSVGAASAAMALLLEQGRSGFSRDRLLLEQAPVVAKNVRTPSAKSFVRCSLRSRAAESLLFARPKRSNQEKSRPVGIVHSKETCGARRTRARSATRRSNLRSRCSLGSPRSRHSSLFRDGIADPRCRSTGTSCARVPIPAPRPRASSLLGRLRRG